MKAFVCLLLLLVLPALASAQVTLVKGAPNQVFDLSCPQCGVTVEDVALWKGTRLLPYKIASSGLVNLLHWKYYDNIMKAEVTTSRELPWEKCTQLLDSLKSTDTVSLQINLSWADSTAQVHRIFLLVSGLRRSDLDILPLYGETEINEVKPKHFAAIAQIKQPDGKMETYETLSGEMSLTNFDPKTGAVGGTFEFTANCIGWVKRGMFNNGVFKRE
jgi:hypothetical protein